METISTKQIGENLRARCIEELSDAVKKIAETGRWDIPAPDVCECAPEEVATMAFALAERSISETEDGLPSWFVRAASGAATVLNRDELRGLECLTALYRSTARASEAQRMAALERLLKSLSPMALSIAL